MKQATFKAVLLAALWTLGAAAALAAHHGDKAGQHIDALTERLALTEAQIPEVEAILADARAQRQVIGDSYTLNQRAEARQAMRELRERTRTRMAAVLDSEQLAKLDEMQQRRLQRREHRREHRRTDRRTDAPSADKN